MMHLRLLFQLLPAIVLGSACSAPSDVSIIVSAARAPGDKCDFTDPTIYVEGGAIDLSAEGLQSSYFQVFGWENNLQQISTTVNGDQISGPTLNTFIANRIELSYVLVGGTAPPAGVVNISASIPAGATPDKNTVGVELLTQQAVAAIFPGVPVLGPTQTLLVTFQIAGALVGGGSASTNPVTYPLTLFKGIPPVGGVCPAGTAPQTTSCNVPGRDIQYCVPVGP